MIQAFARLVQVFLRNNEVEDLKSLPSGLEEGLADMLKGGMAKRRKTNPIPTGDCSVIEDTSGRISFDDNSEDLTKH